MEYKIKKWPHGIPCKTLVINQYTNKKISNCLEFKVETMAITCNKTRKQTI